MCFMPTSAGILNRRCRFPSLVELFLIRDRHKGEYTGSARAATRQLPHPPSPLPPPFFVNKASATWRSAHIGLNSKSLIYCVANEHRSLLRIIFFVYARLKPTINNQKGQCVMLAFDLPTFGRPIFYPLLSPLVIMWTSVRSAFGPHRVDYSMPCRIAPRLPMCSFSLRTLCSQTSILIWAVSRRTKFEKICSFPRIFRTKFFQRSHLATDTHK